MAIAVRNEGAKVNSNINVTPMVDVMLVLLIIFMVITPMLQNKVADRYGPGGQCHAMPDADKEDAIVVAITRDGAYSWGRTRSIPRQLGSSGAREARRQDRQDHLCPRRCARPVQSCGRRHRRCAHGWRGRRGLLTQKREGNQAAAASNFAAPRSVILTKLRKRGV
jgi:biopolymer transport protein ExbD